MFRKQSPKPPKNCQQWPSEVEISGLQSDAAKWMNGQKAVFSHLTPMGKVGPQKSSIGTNQHGRMKHKTGWCGCCMEEKPESPEPTMHRFQAIVVCWDKDTERYEATMCKRDVRLICAPA